MTMTEIKENEQIRIHGDICEEIKALYARKNRDYGDSFAKARKEVPCYTLGKLYDKFERYKNLTKTGQNPQVVSESIDDTLMDLANYAIMELTERKRDKQKLSNIPYQE